jgi:4-diphosphocytidyl-2-C-methyl-D-erythritol kinase
LLVSVPCPIKINLTLRVLGGREDGYHDIGSLFWKVRSPESIDVRLCAERDSLEVIGVRIEGENIVSLALTRTREAGGALPPCEIILRKAIPPGSGVGAGSGNAAAFVTLTREAGFVKEAGAAGIAAALGADVAFLASPYELAWASGKGEKLEGIDGGLDLSAVLFFPQWSSDTKEAYRALEDARSRGYRSFCSDAPGSMSSAGLCSPPEPDAAGGTNGAPANPEETESGKDSEWFGIDGARARSEGMSVLDSLRSHQAIGLLPNDFIPVAGHDEEYKSLWSAAEEHGAVAYGLCGSGSGAFALFARDGDGDSDGGAPRMMEFILRENRDRFEWLGQILFVG